MDVAKSMVERETLLIILLSCERKRVRGRVSMLWGKENSRSDTVVNELRRFDAP